MKLRKAEISLNITEDGLKKLKKYSDQLKSQSEQLEILTSEINQTISKINNIKIHTTKNSSN